MAMLLLSGISDEALQRAVNLSNVASAILGVAALVIAGISLRQAIRSDLSPLRLDHIREDPGGQTYVDKSGYVPVAADSRLGSSGALLATCARPESPTFKLRSIEHSSEVKGALPPIWNAEARNPNFVGRRTILRELQERFAESNDSTVQILWGIGGVGKTQLALEYAYRFANHYTIVWWVEAERQDLIAEQFAALAIYAEWVEPDTDIAAAWKVALTKLQQEGGWLIVFDNAVDPIKLRASLPNGPGHVIVTSRSPWWSEIGVSLAVEEMERAESIELLCSELAMLNVEDADHLADALGDLPLALVQAAGTISVTGMTADDYCALLMQESGPLLTEPVAPTHPVPLTAVVRLSLNRLGQNDTAAAQLLELCAFLAPEPIPLFLFTSGLRILPQPLSETAANTLALRRILGHINRYGLARISAETIKVHRLTQSILRSTMDDSHRQECRKIVEGLVWASRPDDGRDPQFWPTWSALMPHILALDPGRAESTDVRNIALDAVWYLLCRGDVDAGRSMAEHFCDEWAKLRGAEDLDTIRAMNHLAYANRRLGDYRRARGIDSDALTRLRRICGRDDLFTLRTANNLAIDLMEIGEYEAARTLNQDTFSRKQRVLGLDHPDTLRTATNVAIDLRIAGRIEEARRLNVDTLKRLEQMLGCDHPDTLRVATNLAVDLRELGKAAEARLLNENTLARQRSVLGEDDLDTLETMTNLALDMRALGEIEESRHLNELALTRLSNAVGQDHPATLRAAINLAEDLKELGQVAEARKLSKDAFTRLEKACGPDHPDTQRAAYLAHLT